MTPRQSEQIRKRILKIKAFLAADKKRWGGEYDDSRGLRYEPPQLFIKLGDYSGGLRYVRWFDKNFPDDVGYAEFLLELTIILFQSGKLKEAEKRAFQTFCSNTYVFDKYFDRPIVPIIKFESLGGAPDHIENLEYSCNQSEFAEFMNWLRNLTNSEKFISSSTKYIEIHKRLNTEDDRETRHYLVEHAYQLMKSF
jgi:hypothetical protein